MAEVAGVAEVAQVAEVAEAAKPVRGGGRRGASPALRLKLLRGAAMQKM